MNISFLLLIVCTATLQAQEGRLIRNPIRNIPKAVRTEFTAQHVDDRYTITYQLYPYYLKGDFNGDGRRDFAIQITEKSTGKAGVAIFHGKKPQALSTQVIIAGAGKPLGKAGDDLRWVNFWNVDRKRKGSLEMWDKSLQTLKADALTMGRRDSTSGLIYWDGKKYSWSKLKQ
ncbi:MAG: hypothetical protein HYR76_06155 [Ignavibacteria bacterium]|nr:hypothetical protein [Ignavibacteria bacterium]